jgi:hypothetical protein
MPSALHIEFSVPVVTIGRRITVERTQRHMPRWYTVRRWNEPAL